MTSTGRRNLNWTKFKSRYLFSLNAGIAISLVLYFTRKDLVYHWIPLLLVISCFISDRLNQILLLFFRQLGHVNSRLILTIFYFFIFTPFSVIYRLFFLHDSFKKGKSSWIKNDRICDFDQPF